VVQVLSLEDENDLLALENERLRGGSLVTRSTPSKVRHGHLKVSHDVPVARRMVYWHDSPTMTSRLP
jgi:hypothetical protein